MRLLGLLIMGFVCVGGGVAHAAKPVYVRVTDPYIELRTGAGEEFPIFYVAERDEKVRIIMRRKIPSCIPRMEPGPAPTGPARPIVIPPPGPLTRTPPSRTMP